MWKYFMVNHLEKRQESGLGASIIYFENTLYIVQLCLLLTLNMLWRDIEDPIKHLYFKLCWNILHALALK